MDNITQRQSLLLVPLPRPLALGLKLKMERLHYGKYNTISEANLKLLNGAKTVLRGEMYPSRKLSPG